MRTALGAVVVSAAIASVGATVMALLGEPALAQGWRMPWETRETRPAPQPREPVYRAPPPPAGSNFSGASNSGTSVCLQLEQRLAVEANRGRAGATVDRGQQIAGELRNAERALSDAQRQLERNDCWEYFLFQKSLRRSRVCFDFNRRAEEAQYRIRELDAQRQEYSASGSRSYADEIIRELARNNCGPAYAQEARRRDQQPFNPFASLWQDEDSGRGSGNTFGGLPFATYRTLCVRLCDGYYFPVSFSTLPTHFSRDAEICQSKCAAPAELFYYQNPGGAVEQMVSQRSQSPYKSLKTAFKYRKEYIKGCSCKVAEYSPDALPVGTPQRADASRGQGAPSAPGTSSWNAVTTGAVPAPAVGSAPRAPAQ